MLSNWQHIALLMSTSMKCWEVSSSLCQVVITGIERNRKKNLDEELKEQINYTCLTNY